ncbi:MAG: PAS domain S-box protein [Thermodesulfobacteriota bacterium]|nr:PAS domain S-box protein [Thermodesulfobacteriota bacterium]
MEGKGNTKEQLISEIAKLREHINELELTKARLIKEVEEFKELFNLFEESGDAIYITDREGPFIDVNQPTLKLFGYTRKEMIGLDILKIYVNPDDRLELQKKIEKKGVVRDYEVKFRKKDGIKMDCLLTSTVRKSSNGTILGYQGIIRDRTKEKLTEKVLKDSEARYRLLFESNPQPMWVYDIKTLKFIAVNDAAIQHYGFSRNEFLSMTIKDIWPPEDPFKVLKAISKLAPADRHPSIWRHRKKDGSIIDVETVSLGITFSQGDARLVIVSDITEKKQAEKEGERIQTQLLQEQKMEVVGLLAGGIAHDFNNLLTTIQGYTDLALMKIKKTDPLYRNLKQIEHSSLRASDLIRQLLLFSHRKHIEFVPLNINESIYHITKMVKRLIGDDIDIIKYLEPDIWIVRADAENIEQMIMDLVVNARDAMPKGGQLTISTENIYIDEGYVELNECAYTGEFVCLSVADTGVGIEKDIITHIFEPFFSTKMPRKGLGLGLSAVNEIVKQHQGWINVHSKPGQGALFQVFLPAFQKN